VAHDATNLRQEAGERMTTPDHARGTVTERALARFHAAANTVPAYRTFLAEHGIETSHVVTADDFRSLPVVTKANYIDRWPLRERLIGGEFRTAHTISRSSGSSGHARSWPRGQIDEVVGAALYERLLDEVVGARSRDVLCVVAFAMGTWIAGTYTVAALTSLAERGLRTVVVSPGIEIEEITQILGDLAPQFDATVIFGYPPFVRQALEYAQSAGVDLTELSLSCALSGESTTENSRDHLRSLIGRPGEMDSVLSVYGAADIGLIGIESESAAALRQRLHRDPELRRALDIPDERLPTLLPVDGRHHIVESRNQQLVFTTDGCMPLIRYRLGDAGTVLDPDVVNRVAGTRFDSPLIVLGGRHDVCATYYGINIYPEPIRDVVEAAAASCQVTGRFTLTATEDEDARPSLVVQVELPDGARRSDALAESLAEEIFMHLCATSSEYRRLAEAIGKQPALPRVELAASGSSRFPNGRAKHRWVEMNDHAVADKRA